MTTMNLKPSPLIAAVLAVAAFYYFTQRKVSAQPLTSPAPGVAARNAGTLAYLVTPGQQSNPKVQQSIVQSGIGVVQSLLNLAQGPVRSSDNTFNPPGAITYTTDRLPAYAPDIAGEEAARAYFLGNPDEFISNPPPTFVYNDGQIGGGGWLDQQ